MAGTALGPQSTAHEGTHTTSPLPFTCASRENLILTTPLYLASISTPRSTSITDTMSSIVPRLHNLDDDVQLVGLRPAPAAAATATAGAATAAAATTISSTAVNGGNPNAAAAAATSIGFAKERAFPLPTKTEIQHLKYQGLCTVLVAEVLRRRLHVIAHQNKRSAASNTFYQDCLCDNGIMKSYMWSKSAFPGKVFKAMVYSGIEWDGENYSTRVANGDELSELEIMSNYLVIERDEAAASHKAMADAK